MLPLCRGNGSLQEYFLFECFLRWKLLCHVQVIKLQNNKKINILGASKGRQMAGCSCTCFKCRVLCVLPLLSRLNISPQGRFKPLKFTLSGVVYKVTSMQCSSMTRQTTNKIKKRKKRSVSSRKQFCCCCLLFSLLSHFMNSQNITSLVDSTILSYANANLKLAILKKKRFDVRLGFFFLSHRGPSGIHFSIAQVREPVHRGEEMRESFADAKLLQRLLPLHALSLSPLITPSSTFPS